MNNPYVGITVKRKEPVISNNYFRVWYTKKDDGTIQCRLFAGPRGKTTRVGIFLLKEEEFLLYRELCPRFEYIEDVE